MVLERHVATWVQNALVMKPILRPLQKGGEGQER